MRKPVEFATGLRRGVSGKLFKALKLSYQVIRRPFASPERVLFIVGCPRSGTTLLHDLLDGELDIKIYGERSPLTSHDTTDHIRLNDLGSVRSTLSRAHARMVVVKPLVETQNTPQLLAGVPTSKALFVYRHFRDVVASDLRIFGIRNGILNLTPIVDGDDSNWRSQRTSARVRNTILQHFSSNMNPYDAAALFWYARNSLFFDLGLDRDPAVRLLQYERLIAEPAATINEVLHFAGLGRGSGRALTHVRHESERKSHGFELSAGVLGHCEELLRRLDDCRERQAP